jgi:hypothetical protein
MRIVPAILAVFSLISTLASAEEAKTLAPKPITLNAKPCGEGWREWEGIGNLKGMVAYRERLTSICASAVGDVWVGTSLGRLLSMANDRWTLQADLGRLQITGIAVEEPDKVWLSTSDGIRRLSRDKDAWRLTEYRQYYQGSPSFVSGGYIPGEDSVRLWGYVDGIYVPPKNRTYSPFVVSTEHGLFSFGGRFEIWHHFMGGYWGGNSDWLDIRELIPHRRPTRVVEDADANLWIGTEWDGIVRLNATARDYHNRTPENNKKDGTEFTFIDPKEVGCEFDRVVDLSSGREQGVWMVLGLKDCQSTLARFDGEAWTTMTLPGKSRKAMCIAEIEPDVILVGTASDFENQSMFKVDWKSQKVEPVHGPQYNIFGIVTLPDGRVFAASWFGLYERSPQR